MVTRAACPDSVGRIYHLLPVCRWKRGAGGSHPHGMPLTPRDQASSPSTSALVGGVPVGSHKGMEFGQNNLFSLFWMPTWRRGRRCNYIG